MDDQHRNQVFISYAREDAPIRDEFQRMLAPARERGMIDVWADDAIAAGESWSQNIRKALDRARVGLLLVTDHFLQSEFITNVELADLMGAAREGGVSIRWVPVSSSLYEYSALGEIQACCDPRRPLDALSSAERGAVIHKICLEIVQEFGVQRNVSAGVRERLRAAVQSRVGRKYTITEEVGTGKCSIVYRAERKRPKQAVAIKAFVGSDLDDWARQGFVECVERAFALHSPAFIKIFDHSMDESPEYLVSEFVAAERLSDVLHHHPDGLPLVRVKSILLDLAGAIEEAHQRGFRRGEMCPSDILVEESGLARVSPMDFSNVLSEQAVVGGSFLLDRESLSYMTPERYFGHPGSLLTDQYSLGIVATELLGGPWIPRVVRPCDLEAKPQLFADLESGNGKWAERSPELTGVVSRMLRVDPEARWPSITDVRRILRDIEVADSDQERHRKLARASYVRLQARGIKGEREFFGAFYRNLFAAAPDVERLFASIDMGRQYAILNRAILALVEFRPESPAARKHLEGVAARHGALGLSKRHYDLFLETLLETIASIGGQRPDEIAAWRATLAPAIEFLWGLEEKTRTASPPPAAADPRAAEGATESSGTKHAKSQAAGA